MKRWILYAVAFLVAILLSASPFRGTDIAKLQPVEVVWLAKEDGRVLLMTDTGSWGRGENVRAALSDMRAAAAGTIFLDTADYLVIEQGAEELLDQVLEILRPSCMLCYAVEMPNLQETAAFFAAHEPDVTLRQWRNGQTELPLLKEEAGRLVWDEP